MAKSKTEQKKDYPVQQQQNIYSVQVVQNPPPVYTPTVPNPYNQTQNNNLQDPKSEIPSANAPMLKNEGKPKIVDRTLRTFGLTTPWFWYIFSLLMIIYDVVVLLFRVDKMMANKDIIFPFMNVIYIICCFLTILGFLLKYRYFDGKGHYLILPLIIMFVVQSLVYIISFIGLILTFSGAKNIGLSIDSRIREERGRDI